MKINLCIKSLVLFVLFSFSGCVQNTVDSQYLEMDTARPTLRSLVTKSQNLESVDSLVIKSRLQADLDNLMMGRIIYVDSMYVLAIKKEDALFLGVTDEIYDSYLGYVERLNEK
jgi:hypothetical protein